jgi:hypothetical protein
MNVRDSRVHNYPPRWNGAPSQDLLVIRRNHKTSEVSLDPLRWGLIPYWCEDPKGGRKPINAKCETVRTLPSFREAYRKRRCTGRINVRLRAHQYSTGRIDIVFHYEEKSLRVPGNCPHGGKCCEKAHNTFHVTW